jgi:hypothetical protein
MQSNHPRASPWGAPDVQYLHVFSLGFAALGCPPREWASGGISFTSSQSTPQSRTTMGSADQNEASGSLSARIKPQVRADHSIVVWTAEANMWGHRAIPVP